MKVPYIEGVANHSGPESCVGARKGAGEALTGVRAGRTIEPRNCIFRDADAVQVGGRQHRRPRYMRAAFELRAVEEPRHARKSPCARTGRSHDRPS